MTIRIRNIVTIRIKKYSEYETCMVTKLKCKEADQCDQMFLLYFRKRFFEPNIQIRIFFIVVKNDLKI